MQNCGFDKAISEMRRFVTSIPKEVIDAETQVGEAAVEYAVKHGSYHDVTGRLRSSNKFKADIDGLTIYNNTPYASDVEARGKEVISGAILYAKECLDKI